MVSKEYLIHDNGGRPFKVEIKSDNDEPILVFKQSEENDLLWEEEPFLFLENVKDVFLGWDVEEENMGNSILLELYDNYYLYIGSEIYMFETDEPIEEYYSPVGNNDVPYPSAWDGKYAYLLIEKKRIPYPIGVSPQTDPYDLYYGTNYGEDRRRINSVMKNHLSEDLDVKVVQKRL